MLHRPRPKSQPPIKFNANDSNSNIKWNSNGGRLMLHRYRQLAEDHDEAQQQQCKLSRLVEEETTDKAELLELSSPSTSSSSSSSSLASSSLSLSTNSSTSTVLAALNTIAKPQTPSMIARFAQKTSSEEDEDQSSSSSSSGLSSMSSNRLNEPAVSSSYSAEAEAEDEVRRCLGELVSQVVLQEQDKTTTTTTTESPDFQSFRLNEVLLAETSQQTTSGSSDDGGSPVLSSSANKEDEFEEQLPTDTDDVAHLVQCFSIKHPSLSDSLLLHLARQQLNKTSDLADQKWSVSLKVNERMIEWAPFRGNKLQEFESVSVNLVQRCLVEQQLVVWVLKRSGRNVSTTMMNPDCAELETTLDDIALALDEPISGTRNSQQEAIVWLCSSEPIARRMGNSFGRISSEAGTPSLGAADGPKQRELPEEDVIDNRASAVCCSQDEKLVSLSAKSSSAARSLPASIRNETDQQHHSSNECRRSAESETTKATAAAAPVPARSNNGRQEQQRAPKVSAAKVGKSDTGKTEDADKRQKRPDKEGAGLASYYKQVASKVISNSQSRIKSFREEMSSKLNNRTSVNLSAATIANKRVSQKQQQQQLQQLERPNGGLASDLSEDNLSTLLDSGKAAAAAGADHQRPATATPLVKPRTSILKSKLVGAGNNNNGCDSTVSSTTDLGAAAAAARHSALVSGTRHPLSATQPVKPRSILKSSKSVSNIAQQSQVNTGHRGPMIEGSGGSHPALHETANNSLNNSSPSEPTKRKSLVAHAGQYYAGAGQTLAARHSAAHRRRSTYSLIEVSQGGGDVEAEEEDLDDDDEEEEEEEEEEPSDEAVLAHGQAGRDQAFERIRQRASCYDISRLMSKQCLQSQLAKLRSGSTNSIAVASRNRQRRPALLLASSSAPASEESKPIAKQEVEGTVRVRVTAGARASVVQEDPVKPMVQGRAAQVDSTVSAQGGRRQQMLMKQQLQQQQQQVRDDMVQAAVGRKKSEFDPRSLRRLPPGLAQQQELAVAKTVASRRSIVVAVGEEQTGSAQVKQSMSVTVDKKVEKSRESDVDDEEEEEEEEEEEQPASSSSGLSKKGPFSLLRQSFSQKSLSNMLKFSGRASMRFKPPVVAANEPANEMKLDQESSEIQNGRSTTAANRNSAIAIAEANLLAAKQLKQQAQRLKEQQKREAQQQAAAAASLDQTSMMLAAVQYNQQLRQQQQLMYHHQQQQQHHHQYRFDPMHLQHQLMMQQQRQQQQLAYMNSAQHYMAAQHMQVAMHQPAPMMVAPQPPPPPAIYMQPPTSLPQPTPSSSATTGLFRKSILKGSSKAVVGPEMVYHQHQQLANQQLIPMAVNHHSSFNIVYAQNPPTAAGVGQLSSSTSSMVGASQSHYQVQNYEQQQPPPVQQTKHSTLGASMRKSVKSILIKSGTKHNQANKVPVTVTVTNDSANHKQLKSSLKSSANVRELVLNSEGSDGDGSSSDSATNTTTTSSISAGCGRAQLHHHHHHHHSHHQEVLPKSALKRSSTSHNLQQEQQQQLETSSATSSDSTCSSSDSVADYKHNERNTEASNKGNLIRGFDYRQSIKVNGSSSQDCYPSPSMASLRASKRKSTNGGTTGRKNVTFSTKLTSIL